MKETSTNGRQTGYAAPEIVSIALRVDLGFAASANAGEVEDDNFGDF